MKVRWEAYSLHDPDCLDEILRDENGSEVAFAAADGSYSLGDVGDNGCYRLPGYRHGGYDEENVRAAKAAAMDLLEKQGFKLELADD